MNLYHKNGDKDKVTSDQQKKIDWKILEKRWKDNWEKLKLFNSEPDLSKPKYFITVAYPYPNSPQHIGHARTYALADVHARYMRMKGYNVLFPMGFHYTGSPILGMSRRVESRDSDLLETFKKIYDLNDDVINTFIEPLNIARYFHEEIKQGMKEMGYSIDWRREFTTIDPLYSKLISWQFKKLKDKGLIVQGSHPVGWCPKDKNPVSQHDTMGDVEPDFQEYLIIKFHYGNKIIFPAVTLRPETLFGVTNLWINPSAAYCKVRVGDEHWIVSKEAVKKLEFLNYNPVFEEDVDITTFIETYVLSPITKTSKKILPATFVKADGGTGIVMSVPAHAPYDLQALIDLKNDIHNNYDVKDISPIKIIRLPEDRPEFANYVEFVLKKYDVSNQNDQSLDKATTEIYSIEFYKGKMMENVARYSGIDVSLAKEKIKEDLLHNNDCLIFYELINKPVFCRCGTECVVKILNDQWFLNYSDESWKDLVRECINKIEIIPFDLRREFFNVVDWLKDRACARKTGLGTILPWDDEWIIESLSDSVIYMVYYILAKYVNKNSQSIDESNLLDISNIDDSFFDYVLLGKGNKETIIKNCNIDENLLNRLRHDFLYYYPVDSRHSGRDLVPNHLTFFIFNHVAIFDKEHWPKQIVVNGSVLMDGKKMSKSLGNIIPLRKAIEEFGVDSIRLSMLISAELLQDADFTFESVKGIRGKLHDIYFLTIQYSKVQSNDLTISELEDKWLLSQLQHRIQDITLSLDKLRIRESLHSILYLMDQDLQWYIKRIQNKKRNNYCSIIRQFLDVRIRLLSPFAPFICEELWKNINGNTDSVMQSTWPTANYNLIDDFSEESEILIRDLIMDIQNIIKVTRITPMRIIIYTRSNWKAKLYSNIINIIDNSNGKIEFRHIMKSLIEDTLATYAKKDPSLIRKMVDDILSISSESRNRRKLIGYFDEKYCINDAKTLIINECGLVETEILIFSEDDSGIYDPKLKSKFARPYKPAILIE